MHLRAINASRGTLLAVRAMRATSFFARFLGLMGRKHFPVGQGLHIVPCNSIHTFFMRIPIDVLFLGDDGRLLRMEEAMPPWRTVLPVKGALSVLELPAGTVRGSGTRPGDIVRFEPSVVDETDT